jgi:hypothetical protein
MRLGQVQAQTDKTEEAVVNLGKAVKILDTLATRYPNSHPSRFPSMEAKFILGELLREQNELDESARLLSESVVELKKLMKQLSRHGFVRRIMSRHLKSLAETLALQGKKEEAAQLTLLADEMVNMPRRERESP